MVISVTKMLCSNFFVISFLFHLILFDYLQLLLCDWSQYKFSVLNCSRQFWLKCRYIGPTGDISFIVVLSVHQLSPIDLMIVSGSSAVIFFPHLRWHFYTERETFFCKYNSKTFLAFSLGSAKRRLFCEQSCVEDKDSLECSDSLACSGAFKLVFFFLPSCARLLEEGSKRFSIISGTSAFYLILNEGFPSTVFTFSNVSANPDLKFRKASTWEARRFSVQLCHLALLTESLLCVVASS